MRTTIALAALLATAAGPASAVTVFSGSGASIADLTPVVTAYRTALGANNGVTPGPLPSGRREISWDGGGPAALATLFPSTMTTFAGRGTTFTTPGTGFEISGLPSPEFGDINPTYPDVFQTFSAPRLFTPLGSNVTDVHFNLPGAIGRAALTRGFGAVFADVDLPSVTGIQFFDRNGVALAPVFFANAQGPGQNGGLSFLGVLFDDPVIARARIITGDTAVGPNDGPADVVVMDDFIFAEPVAIPEPSAWSVMLLGFGLAGSLLRRRRGAASASTGS